MKIYFQGKIVDQSHARVSANDHGLLYGLGLFETFRTFNGNPFLLEEHLQRMQTGCESYQIHPPPDSLLSEKPPHSRLREVVRELLRQNHLPEAVFRFTVTAGEAPPGLPLAPYSHPTEMIHLRPLPPPLPEEGQRIHVLDTSRRDPEVSPRPKSTHYANSLAGHWELRQRPTRPGDEGLMLTQDGRIAEGIVSNIFLLNSHGLQTPALSAGILPGITRQKVLHLAAELKIPAQETDLGLCDLTDADAIFTTNSVRGIVPVAEVFAVSRRAIWREDSAKNSTLRDLLHAYQLLSKTPDSE